jgi:hypothetical protein
MPGSERRHSPRRDCDFPVRVHDYGGAERSRGRVYNVSRTGAYVELDKRLEPESELVMMAEPGDIPPPFSKAWISVRWVREIEAAVVLNTFAAGVQFVRPPRGGNGRPRLRVIAGGVK